MNSKFLTGTVSIIFFMLVAWGVLFILKPFPNEMVVYATDYSGSAWNVEGTQTIALLEKHGIKLNVVETEGAIQNIELLNDEKSKVNAALLFGGLIPKNQIENISSLAYVGYSPIWIFFKVNDGQAPKSLADLAKKTISIGPKKSGSYALVKNLFELQGIDIEKSPNFISAPFSEGLNNYMSGKANVIIFVGDRDDPVVKKLFYDAGTKIFEMNKSDLDYLSQDFIAVKLPARSIDVDRKMPEKDVHMISTATILAVKRDMQPAVQVGLLLAASKIMRDLPYLIPDTQIQFPAPAYDAPLEVSSTAKKYFANGGPPWLTNFFPTWLAYSPL